MTDTISKADAFFSGPTGAAPDASLHDPMELRGQHFTMKVNAFELELIEKCAQTRRISKAALIRHLIDEYAKEKGIF